MKAGCTMCYPVEMNEETFFMMIEIDARFWMRSAKWLTIMMLIFLHTFLWAIAFIFFCVRKSVDPEKVLEKAAGILNCDLDYIRHSRRLPKLIKDDRDLLVYLVWKICLLSNEETGRLFGMTYSAISHILSSMRTRMQKDSDLRVKYNNIYSLCKM